MFSASGIAARTLVTETISTSRNWVAPATTSQIEAASGKGATGYPSSYNGDVNRSATLISVHGIASSTVYGFSPAITWDNVQAPGYSATSQINGGGSGNLFTADYVVNPSTNTWASSNSQVFYSNAIPGSAFQSYTGNWKTSGPVSDGEFGQNTLLWREYGATSPASTGASTTAFGKDFPGGVGGSASVTNYPAPFAITPGATYAIVIAAGGFLTISYYK